MVQLTGEHFGIDALPHRFLATIVRINSANEEDGLRDN
jgi:hypothetical protein